jgi:hypothetical protein
MAPRGIIIANLGEQSSTWHAMARAHVEPLHLAFFDQSIKY